MTRRQREHLRPRRHGAIMPREAVVGSASRPTSSLQKLLKKTKEHHSGMPMLTALKQIDRLETHGPAAALRTLTMPKPSRHPRPVARIHKHLCVVLSFRMSSKEDQTACDTHPILRIKTRPQGPRGNHRVRGWPLSKQHRLIQEDQRMSLLKGARLDLLLPLCVKVKMPRATWLKRQPSTRSQPE